MPYDQRAFARVKVMPAVPIRLDGSTAAIGHPPTLGQHNDEILA